MKKLMKKRLMFSLCGAFSLLLSACDFSDSPERHGEFYYSNPTDTATTIVVDDKNYEIEPFSMGMVKLDSGMHTMKNAQGETISFMVFDFNEGGILNPSEHLYYALSEIYAKEVDADRFRPVQTDVMINGYQLKMPLKSANAVVMGANYLPCRYPIGVPFPEHIVVGDKNMKGNIQSKCFDKPELLSYLKQQYEMDLTPESVRDYGRDSITPMPSIEIPAPAFPDATMQEIAEQLIALLETIKGSDNPKIHQELNPQFHELILALLAAKQALPERNDPKLSTIYNDFIDEISQFVVIVFGFVKKMICICAFNECKYQESSGIFINP